MVLPGLSVAPTGLQVAERLKVFPWAVQPGVSGLWDKEASRIGQFVVAVSFLLVPLPLWYSSLWPGSLRPGGEREQGSRYCEQGSEIRSAHCGARFT